MLIYWLAFFSYQFANLIEIFCSLALMVKAIMAAAGQATIKALPQWKKNWPLNPRLIQVTQPVIIDESISDINPANIILCFIQYILFCK